MFVLSTGYKMSHELLKAAYDLSFYSSEFEKEQYQFLGGMYRFKKSFVSDLYKKIIYFLHLVLHQFLYSYKLKTDKYFSRKFNFFPRSYVLYFLITS